MEENNQTPAPEEKKPAKSMHVNIDEWIARFRLAFTNGKLPEILPLMETVGYTQERLEAYLQATNELEAKNQRQKKEYSEQYAETDKFNILRSELGKLFRKHRALVKILFKGNVGAYSLLRLNDEPTVAYSSWVQLLTNFYSQIKNDPQLLVEVQKVNIGETDVDTALAQLQTLRTLKKSQRKELSEAQAATEERDTAFDHLYPLYREFVEYAKILLTDNQLLEALGIVVKRQ